MPTLTIPEETMRALIGEAILKGIDQDARNTLIQSAINHLIAPSKVKGQYGREEVGPSPIEEAFNNAVRLAAQDYVRQWVTSSDEAQAALRGQLDELLASYKSKLDESWEFKTALNEWVIDYLSKKAADRY
jgi:hypothetical protein